MNILIIHTDLEDFGGVSNYYKNLRGKFSIPVKYLTVGKRPTERGILRKIPRMVVDYWRFVKYLQENDIDLVHINPSLDFKSFVRDGVFALLAKLHKKKLVTFFHGWKKSCEICIEGYFLWLFSLFFRKSDALIVLSNEIKETLERWCVVQPIYKEVTVINDNELAGFNIQIANIQQWNLSLQEMAKNWTMSNPSLIHAISAMSHLRVMSGAKKNVAHSKKPMPSVCRVITRVVPSH
jgi:hypothetical protein